MDRKIIHIDMDCFFVAIEVRDRPELRNKAVAVGGRERGVLSTANYEARKYGVGSAMPVTQAKKLCPHLIILPHSPGKYKKEAKRIRKIFYEYTNIVQAVSVDEAYLDVTQCKQKNFRYAQDIAQHLRQNIYTTTGLTASAGIAPNKLIAKIASEYNKPNGQLCVPPSRVLEFMENLNLRKIPGIGKASFSSLQKNYSVQTCSDLQKIPKDELIQSYGNMGGSLYKLCRGIDTRQVHTDRGNRKSLSLENTFFQNLPDHISCQAKITRLYEDLFRRFQRCSKALVVKSFFVKIKYSDFQQRSLERQTSKFPPTGEFRHILKELYYKNKKPVRLLGLGVRFSDNKTEQMQFYL